MASIARTVRCSWSQPRRRRCKSLPKWDPWRDEDKQQKGRMKELPQRVTQSLAGSATVRGRAPCPGCWPTVHYSGRVKSRHSSHSCRASIKRRTGGCGGEEQHEAEWVNPAKER
eukprot:5692412-Prymnesium_polylepis.1